MTIDNRLLRNTLVILLILLLIPVAGMLVMMAAGAATGRGMMSGMTGMMSSGGDMMALHPWFMALCFLWLLGVGAALVVLLVLITRGVTRA